MTETEAAITAAWRRESTRLVAALARMTRDLDLAEDLAQDALVAALEQWPATGVPGNPAAWLMAVAKRRAVDQFRRAETLRRRTDELGHRLEEAWMPDLEAAADHIEDDVLRLMFLSCHPVLAPESRAALTLRLVAGLTTAEIARALLAKEATVGQRISRAKRTLAQERASFDMPTGREREERLVDVMAVIYLLFNEGYAATSGDDWMRPDLCLEATRLARMLAVLVPDDPEVLSLQALLELQGSRAAARLDAGGHPVLLEDQDRRRWDMLLAHRGLLALARAQALGKPVGTYFLQASIAACHARARAADQTEWARIAALYDRLAEHAPGAVVELNRAVAHGRAFGADRGLEVLESIQVDALAGTPLYPAVHADLLLRSGRYAEAATRFREAAGVTGNRGEQELLVGRAEAAESMSKQDASAARDHAGDRTGWRGRSRPS